MGSDNTGLELTEIESETALALSAGRGEEGAIDHLIGAMRSRVGVRVRATVPADDVDDVIQDIWINLYRSIGRFEARSSFRTWFYPIIRNRIANYWRCCERYGRKIEYYEANPRDSHTDLESYIEIEQFFSRLPKTYRDIIWQHIMEGQQLKEYAALHELKYERVRSNYRRGRAWCRSHRAVLGLPLDL